MILKVTDKLGNGEIVIPTVGYPLKKGHSFSIPDEKYYNSDIQHCVKNNLIISEKTTIINSEGKVCVKNISGRHISVAGIPFSKDESIYVDKNKMEDPSFDLSFKNQLIEKVDDNKKTKSKVKEVKVNESKVSKKKVKKVTRIEDVFDNDSDQDNVKEVEIIKKEEHDENIEKDVTNKMGSWDPFSKTIDDKAKSFKKTMKMLNSKTSEEINKNDII